jgi:hypothetical protein
LYFRKFESSPALSGPEFWRDYGEALFIRPKVVIKRKSGLLSLPHVGTDLSEGGFDMIFAGKTFGTALVVGLMGTAGAFASTIDLTSKTTYTTRDTTSATGSTVEADWAITPVPVDSNLTYYTFGAPELKTPGSPLKFKYDGIGIKDDEVTYPTESLVMTFSTAVDVEGLYVLDLFGDETVTVYANGDANTGISLGTFGGAQPAVGDIYGGYAYFAISSDVDVTSLTFVPGAKNDNAGKPDFALAGLVIAPIPLPAAGLLLLGGLGALGAAKRRRKAA